MSEKSGSQSAGLGRNSPAQNTAPRESRPPLSVEVVRQRLTTARALQQEHYIADAKVVLQSLIAEAPQYEDPWLQLLALEPPPEEEVPILEGFLRHHPQHRFASAFRSRLNDMQIVVMLAKNAAPPPTAAVAEQSEAGGDAPPPPQRLGDYLIARNWAKLDQIEQALELQRELRKAGVERRLGTLLLMMGHLNQEQLGAALADAQSAGFGEFGSYLIRTGLLTPGQIGQALARQSALSAQQDKKYLRRLSFHRRMQSIVGRLSQAPKREQVPRLGEVLVSMGLLTPKQVEQFLKRREQDFNSSFE